MSSRLWFSLYALGLVLFGAGCAATSPVILYEGPPQPAEKTARVRTPPPQIDVRKFDYTCSPYFSRRRTPAIYVLPGRHTAILYYTHPARQHGGIVYRAVADFDLEAGGEYWFGLDVQGGEHILDDPSGRPNTVRFSFLKKSGGWNWSSKGEIVWQKVVDGKQAVMTYTTPDITSPLWIDIHYKSASYDRDARDCPGALLENLRHIKR